jgi:hypothetical protein
MTRTQSLALPFAFVLGCLAAPLAEQYVARPAQAAPEGVRKWDQWCTSRLFSFGDDPEALAELNQDLKSRGAEGYEVASNIGMPAVGGGFRMFYCLRRPIP